MHSRLFTGGTHFRAARTLMHALVCFIAFSLMPRVGVAAAETKEQSADKPKSFKLPDDPKATVISLNFRGGFTPPRINDGPTISVLANGTVLIPKNYEGQRAFEGKMTPDELQALLREIITDQKFFDYDPKEVDAKIKKAEQANGGLVLRVADAATTVIKVQLADREHEVAVYNLSPHPKVVERRQLHAVQQRMTRLMSVIQLGGPEEVQRWLKLANKELLAAHPKVEPLTADDFQSGGQRADGSHYVYFQRREPRKGGLDTEAGVTVVSINAPAEGEPKVNVTHRPSKAVGKA